VSRDPAAAEEEGVAGEAVVEVEVEVAAAVEAVVVAAAEATTVVATRLRVDSSFPR